MIIKYTKLVVILYVTLYIILRYYYIYILLFLAVKMFFITSYKKKLIFDCEKYKNSSYIIVSMLQYIHHIIYIAVFLKETIWKKIFNNKLLSIHNW